MKSIVGFVNTKRLRGDFACAAVTAGAVTLSGSIARAQGIGQMLGVQATRDLFQLGTIPSWLLYMMAAVLFVVFVSALAAKHKANSHMGWGLVAIPFVASVLCAVAPTLITAGAQTATGQGPTITAGTAVAPIAWQ